MLKGDNRMRKALPFCLGVVLILPLLGCDEYIAPLSRGERLAGIPLRVGDYVPDFEIHDKSGHSVRFSAIRGDVTILAFVAAEQPGKCTILKPLHELAMHWANVATDVEYVSISEPPDARPNPNAKIGQCPDVKLWHAIALCDEGANVRALYRIKKLGVYFVIDDDSRIAAIGDVNDVQALKRDLDQPVRKANMDNSVWNEL